MTEKRFEYKNHKVFDNLTGETHSSNRVSVNVLNALHEENITLKSSNLEYEDTLARMEEENTRLQKERNHFERKKTEYLTEWNTCRIQNTELKKDNQELKEAMKRLMTDLMTKRGV